MSTARVRWAAGAILMVGIGVGLAFAQTGERIAPESLLPKESLLYVSYDGSAENAEAWQETAAYEALYESGLVDVVAKVFTAIQEQSGGQEGIPGQLGGALKHVMEQGVSLSVTLGPGEGRPPMPWAIVVLHEAAPYEQSLSNLAQGAARGEINFETVDVSGRSVTRGLVPQTPGIEVGWWSEGSHLVVVAGIDAVHSAMDVAEGGANITAHPLWEKYRAAETNFTVGSVGWFNFSPLLETFGEMPIPDSQHEGRPDGVTINEVATLLGLDGLKSVAMRSGYKGKALWSEVNIDAPEPRRGLLSLSDQASFSLSDLPPLPANSTAFSASSFDWAGAYDILLTLAHEAEDLLPPEAEAKGKVDQAIAQVRETLGFDLKTGIFEPLGNVHTLYADSGQAPFGLGFGVAIAVDDAQTLRDSLDKLLELLQEEAGRNMNIRRVDRDGQEMVLMEFGEGAMSPAFSVGEKWLTVGIVPQTVDAFLMRQAGTLASWEPTAEIQAALGQVPEEFTAISVSDPRATYQFVLGFAPFFYGAAQAGLRQSGALPPDFEMPVTMADVPPAELVTRPLFPNVTVVGVDQDGVKYTSRVSLSGIPLAGSVDGGTAVATSAVMVALLLPAVQQAREAARRTQSKNNLKQIMLAMHNYHDVYQEFPEGTVPNEKLDPDERLSWQTQMLPFLEQAALFQQIDSESGWEDDVNEELLQTVIPAFVNPSNPHTVTDDGYGETHYVGLAGLGEDGPELPADHRKAGVFAYDRATKIREIRDGTSNTIAISDATDNGPWGAGGKATIRPLTKKPYINGPDGIGGPHQGGVNVGFCDGSVRFISEDIDPDVMEALVTINGGEVIGEF